MPKCHSLNVWSLHLFQADEKLIAERERGGSSSNAQTQKLNAERDELSSRATRLEAVSAGALSFRGGFDS
jgi:hypothetical protein